MGSSENKQAAATFSFQIRTDLALEDKESFEGDGGEIPGVVLKERTRKEGAVRMTEVKILNAQGARAMGKPEGTYLPLEADELQTPDEDCHSRVVDELAMQLNELMKRAGWEKKENPSLLVVGLGNQSVTPDSLGPRTVGNLRVTGHLLADRTEKKQPYPCLCVQDTISALLAVLEENECAKGTGSWIRQMDTDGQYELIRELLEPEFGPMYVTPPDIDQSVQQLSFTISEGIHRAVFEL